MRLKFPAVPGYPTKPKRALSVIRRRSRLTTRPPSAKLMRGFSALLNKPASQPSGAVPFWLLVSLECDECQDHAMLMQMRLKRFDDRSSG